MGGLAFLVLALAPPAHARETAKFKVLSISGATTADRAVVYEPTQYGDTCAFTQTERVSFHSTKPITAYAFTSKAHGRARVEWWSKPTFPGNLTFVEVPGAMTVSRSAAYQQSIRVDPDTGEVSNGCFYEPSPVDCAVERTFPVTLRLGGTSDSDGSTYVSPSGASRDLDALDAACPVEMFPGLGDAPGLFPRAHLFGKRKRVSDTDRVEMPAFDNTTDTATVTGVTVDELAGELKRKKLRSR